MTISCASLSAVYLQFVSTKKYMSSLVYSAELHSLIRICLAAGTFSLSTTDCSSVIWREKMFSKPPSFLQIHK